MCRPSPSPTSLHNTIKRSGGDIRHQRTQSQSHEKSVWSDEDASRSQSQRKSWVSDEEAPYPSDNFTCPQLLWFLCIGSIAQLSIHALNGGHLAASILWIIYECYIVFDHAPFMFTNSVYKSPSFNYRYINLIFFWGLEAVACIVATQSLVGAPPILLYNAMPHCFFVGAHINQTATSKAFLPSVMKTWWVYTQVVMDNIIHLVCLWHHLNYVFAGSDWYTSPLVLWTVLVGAMLLLTCWVHGDEMSFSNVFAVSGANKSMPR